MAKGRIEQEIALKVTGVKEAKEAEKLVEGFEGKPIEIPIEVEGAVQAEKELRDIAAARDKVDAEPIEIDVRTNAQKAADELRRNARLMASELDDAKVAAQRLGDALGSELAGRIDMGRTLEQLDSMGLSMREVADDAEILADSIREVNAVEVDSLESGLGRSTTAMRNLTGAADQSRSVMANFAGNAAQDLGQIAGFGGSAGVALGQFAEYAAEGNIAMSGLVKTAAPLAGIALAVGAIGAEIGDQRQVTDNAKDSTAAFLEVLKEGGDAATVYGQQVAESGEVMVNVFDLLGTEMEEPRSIFDKMFGEDPVRNIVPLLDKAKVTTEEWAAAVIEGGDAADHLADKVKASNLSAVEQEDILAGLEQKHLEYAKAQDESTTANERNALSTEGLVSAYQEWLRLTDPVKAMPEQFNAVADAVERMNRGLEPTADQVVIINELIRLFPNFDVFAAGQDILAGRTEAATARLQEQIEVIQEWAEQQVAATQAADEFLQALAGASGDIRELGNAFSQMGINEDALSSIFDLGNAPLDTLEDVRDLEGGIRDLATFLHDDLEGVMPNIFDPDDVNAGPFLAKISSLRGEIQTQVTNAFAAGGVGDATAVADGWVDKIFTALDGALSRKDIRTLLNLEDLPVTLKLAIDAASKENAIRELEIITGLGGEDLWTAQIALSLDTGEISGNAAKLLLADRAKALGLEVPAGLDIPPSEMNAAKVEADTYMQNHKAIMGMTSTPPATSDLNTALASAQIYLDGKKLTVKVVPTLDMSTINRQTGSNTLPWWLQPHDQGGTASGLGGIAGERGPEILNDRFLTTGPTYVPPGTRVTSRARTTAILRSGRPRRLRTYDQGGMVVPVPVPVNVNVNAAVVGNRFDVMRAVERARLDKLRLLGSR